MAKDDYFVIAYRFLTYLYDCLKKGAAPDKALICAEYYGINEAYWDYILRNLRQDGYVSGVSVFVTLDNPDGELKVQPNIAITPKGLQYLHENSIFQKVREAVKDFSGLMP